MTELDASAPGWLPAESGDGSLTPARLKTIVQACHLNFLIGAGTSTGLFLALGSLEELLTDIEGADAEPHAKRLARASVHAHFFRGVAEPNLLLLQGTGAAQNLLRSYARFGRVLNHLLLNRRSSLLSKKVSIFTTNIDLAIEVSFERLGLELNDGFAGKLRPIYDPALFGALRYRTGAHYEHRAEVPTFDLHKLHGSVGWRLVDDPAVSSGIEFDTSLSDLKLIDVALRSIESDLVKVTPKSTAADLLAAATKLHESPLGLAAFEDAYGRLVIVNPEKQKFATTVLTETYYELIRRFANELERENSVLFVHGFSFRDEHLRKIVVRAARTNPTLQVVVFCYSAKAKSEISALIRDDEIPNSNLAYVQPPDGEVCFSLDEVVDRYFEPLSAVVPREQDTRIHELFPLPDETAKQ